MKKYLFILTALMLLLAGCDKEKFSNEEIESGDVAKIAVTANLQPVSKALIDNDGMGINANRCIMELWYAGKVYGHYVSPVIDKKATFDVTVPAKRTYKVVFWADCATDNGDGSFADLYYNTSIDLAHISIVDDYVGNNDKRDAFFFADDYTVTQNAGNFEATLKRPFAQINVITTDIQAIKMKELYPEEVNLKFKAAKSFNAINGECEDVEKITYSADVYSEYSESTAATQLTLSMDYIFASLDKEEVDIEFSAPTEGASWIEHSFTNIPFQRNYRTNIRGALLTTTSHWDVTIDPDWIAELDYDYFTAGSIADANQALEEGKVSILIQSPTDANNPIIIPSSASNNNISIKAEGTSEQTLTINGGEGPANLYINGDAKNLVINTPKAHVEVNSGNYTDIAAETSATTLVIAKGVTVETLEVNKGNVEIHGVVNALSRKNGVKAEMYASDRATLINYINWAKPGDIAGLECDIDLAGENWTPLRKGNNRFDATFDGQGYSISNMTISLDWANGVGFFSDMSGVARNFTIDNANIANTTADKGNMYGIVAGYAYGNVTFENVNVTNSSIHAFGKVAAILGMAADGNGTTVVKNCKVENTEIIGCYNVANYVGLVQNAIVLEGCTSVNVEKKLGGRYGEDSYVTFDNVKVINNDEENPKYVLSSGKYWEYAPGCYYAAFADCYNDIHYLEWKALEGTVDALVFNTPDAPELKDLEPVATIGDAKYYSLPTALAALQQGETLEIWQAGEYTVETLSTPANTTIDAKVEGVVFNHTAAATSWVANQVNGRTVKNITWNVGNAHHQYIHSTNLENCTVNGLLCTHGTNKFKDCTFINEEGYNFWVYGNEYTEFDNCTFTCPGKNENVTGCGSAINCYNEGAQSPTSVLVIKNCTFTAKEASNKYSAIYIKPETTFDIRITNSTCNDKFCTGAISGSKLWNLKSDKEGTTVSIDGTLVYPFCSKDADGNYHIVNAAGLLQFHDLYAAAKVASTAKVYLDNDIDFTGKTWDACEWHADNATKGFALFDGQNHTIKNFTVSGQGMFSRWAGGATPYFKDIVFDGAKNVTSTLNVSLFCGQIYQDALIENVTIKNSQFEGQYKVAPFVGTVYNENPGNTATLTMKDCKVENTTVRSTKFNYCTCGMVAWVSDIDDNDKIVFEGNNVVKDVTLYKSNVSYNLFGKIYWGDGDKDGVAHDEAANVTVNNVNIVPVQ